MGPRLLTCKKAAETGRPRTWPESQAVSSAADPFPGQPGVALTSGKGGFTVSDEFSSAQYAAGSASSVLFGHADVGHTGAPGGQGAPVAAVPPSTAASPHVSPYQDPYQLGAQVPVGPDLVNPQYTRPAETAAGSGSDYSQTGAGHGSGNMPHPNSDAAVQ